jgi:hypothetical protein
MAKHYATLFRILLNSAEIFEKVLLTLRCVFPREYLKPWVSLLVPDTRQLQIAVDILELGLYLLLCGT